MGHSQFALRAHGGAAEVLAKATVSVGHGVNKSPMVV